MNSISRRILLMQLWTGVCCPVSQAQIDLSKYEVGAQGGLMIYQGDLTPEALGSFKTMKPQFGIHATRKLSGSFSIRLQFSSGKLKGADSLYSNPAWRKERNFHFNASVSEFSALLVWNILAKDLRKPKTGFSPYAFAGIGYGLLRIQRDWSGLNTGFYNAESALQAGLNEDIAHRLPRGIPVFPLGLGMRYAITPRLAVAAESSYRYSFTDYIDGFSHSGNPERNDHYYSHSIGLIYMFPGKNALDCPVVRY